MSVIRFKSCPNDPDVWIHKAVKPDVFKYWELVLNLTDDTIEISHKHHAIMEGMAKYMI